MAILFDLANVTNAEPIARAVSSSIWSGYVPRTS